MAGGSRLERQAALEALLFEGFEPFFEPFEDDPDEDPPESLLDELEPLVAELDSFDEESDLVFSDALALAMEPWSFL